LRSRRHWRFDGVGDAARLFSGGQLHLKDQNKRLERIDHRYPSLLFALRLGNRGAQGSIRSP